MFAANECVLRVEWERRSTRHMNESIFSRREALASIGAAGTLSIAGCFGDDGGGDGTVGTARLSSGATSLVAPLISSEGLDEEYGFELETHVRDSISAYYGDFVGGTYDTLPFGVSAAANRYNQDVDLRLIGGFTYSSMSWITNDSSIESVEDFEGETVAVPLASGSFAVADAVVREQTGQSVEELAGEVINAPGPGGSPPEVITGNATVGLSWEPALSTFLIQENDLEAIVNVREEYRQLFDAESFHLLWAVQNSLLEDDRDAVEGLFQASQDVVELYESDLQGTVDTLVEETDNEPEPLLEAFDSGRLEFAMVSLGELREDIETQLEVFEELEVIEEIPDDGIYEEV